MSVTKPLVVQCPTCKMEVVWSSENSYKPFCSQRCKLIDLGDWATEAHKIPGEVNPDEDVLTGLLAEDPPENW